MVFRPLSPELKSELYLIWNKYQTFTPIAEKFLVQIKKTFKSPKHFFHNKNKEEGE